MLKTIGVLLLIVVLLVIFVEPVRNYMNTLVHKKEKEVALKEEKIIGTVSTYNPRVEELQKTLEDVGFNPGSIDGLMGEKTRTAVKEFQKAQGLPATGTVDSTTWLALSRAKERGKEAVKSSPLSEGAVDLSPAKEGLGEGAAVEDAQAERVGGDSGGEEKAAAQLKSEAEAPDEIINRNLQSEERARQIQMALKKAGFYKGAIDGKVGPQTRKAIKAFQKAKGLMADGVVGPKTWEKLKEFLEERD